MTEAFTTLAEPGVVMGVRLGIGQAGIKRAGRDDLLVMELAPGTAAAAVFTRNAFCAAPVILARRHLAAAAPRALIVNSGNANAGTGEPGLRAARECCAGLAAALGVAEEAVLPFSTGVIGEPLPVERILDALPATLASAASDRWADAARAIMTTDTRPKLRSTVFSGPDGRRYHLNGIAKGAGMIRPDMATMLAYLATDAAVAAPLLDQLLRQSMAQSFNRISVDGDTSTNDACVLLATGAAGGELITAADDPVARSLAAALDWVSAELARDIVRDGEGATKFITLKVSGGRTEAECLDVAYAIAHSPLVKTAFFASDPNWGRLLAAIGRAGLGELDLHGVNLALNQVPIVAAGARHPDYTEAQGQAAMAPAEIEVAISLGRGAASAEVWTCDLGHEYVRINAEYRT
jgi:glutamate N-acetyltransferase / amino-acid N-acetyltransferase